MRNFDKIDRQILALLQSNARENTTALSKKLGVARTTVHERIARMEKIGIIRGYSVTLGEDPLGPLVTGYLLLRVNKQKQSSVVEHLKRFPEIRLCSAVNGTECDLVCMADVPQLEDWEALVVELSDIAGINEIKQMIVTATKFDRRPNIVASGSITTRAALSRGEAG